MALKMAMVVALLSLALVARTVLGQSCNPSTFVKLADCLPAATGTGSVTSKCCSKILAFKGRHDCLCDTLLMAKQAVSRIDVPKALSIPKACKLEEYIPSSFKCGGEAVPGSAP